jgi:hypothetical protein
VLASVERIFEINDNVCFGHKFSILDMSLSCYTSTVPFNFPSAVEESLSISLHISKGTKAKRNVR